MKDSFFECARAKVIRKFPAGGNLRYFLTLDLCRAWIKKQSPRMEFFAIRKSVCGFIAEVSNKPITEAA